MRLILDEGLDPGEAARTYLRENPATIEPWLEGVTTFKGEPGPPAVREALDL